MPDSPSNQVNEKIEQQVRTLIGDLSVQVIVLKNMIDAAQAAAQEEARRAQNNPQSPRPDKPIVPPAPSQPAEPVVPPSGPRPVPQPEPKPQPQQPDVNPNRAARPNGGIRSIGEDVGR